MVEKHLKKTPHYNIAIFIPQQGCPFQCIFCDQRQISGACKSPAPTQVRDYIKDMLCSFTNPHARVEVAFFGGNFTGIPMQEQRAYLEVVQEFMAVGKVHGIRLSTRPDYLKAETIALLKEYGVSCVELGVQSMDKAVLLQSKRGYTPADVETACALLWDSGLKFGLQMMVGLPGDSLDKAKYTANRIVSLGADETRIYPALVIRNTEMEMLWRQGEYTPLSLEDAVSWCAELLPIFEQANVRVLRMGLHPSEGLLSGDSLMEGPFHPAFGQLVETALWRAKFKDLETKERTQNISIEVAAEDFAAAVGHGGVNKQMLKQWYKKVRIKTRDGILNRDFHVDYC